MRKIAILLSALLFGNNSYACFNVDLYQLEQKSSKKIQKYKSIFESMKFSTMDYIKYLKNIKAKDIPNKLISNKRYLLDNNAYQADCAETVRKDLNHIAQFMDIFCELRLAKDKFNEKLLIQKVQQFLSLDNDLSEKNICSASRFLKKLENNNKKYMNTLEYPHLVVDKSLFEFLKPIIDYYKSDIDRYTRGSIIQPDEKHLYNNPLVAYIDRSFKKSGYMQFQSLMNEFHSSFCRFSQNSLPLFRFFEGKPEELEIKNDNDTDQKRSEEKISIPVKPIQQNVVVSENIQIEHIDVSKLDFLPSIEDQSFSKVQMESEKISIGDDAIEMPVSFVKEEIILDDVVEDNFNVEANRWWLGYELEKKLQSKIARDQWRLRGNEITPQVQFVEKNEEETIALILGAYEKNTSFDMLSHIIKPGNLRKLSELNWKTDVKKLLGNLAAEIHEDSSGSRMKVVLNGIKTVFHTHGTIGMDTINGHLREFLIQALGHGL